MFTALTKVCQTSPTHKQCDQMVRLFLNIWPLAIVKISSIMSQICQSQLSILPNMKWTVKILPKTGKIFPKWSHCSQALLPFFIWPLFVWTRTSSPCEPCHPPVRQNLNYLGNILRVFLVFGTILKVLWHLLYAFGLLSVVVNSHMMKKINLTSGPTVTRDLLLPPCGATKNVTNCRICKRTKSAKHKKTFFTSAKQNWEISVAGR